MRRSFVLLAGVGCFLSCHKTEIDPNKGWDWFGTDNPSVYNYVLINANQVANKTDSTDFHINVAAAFIDSSNNKITGINNLSVNNKPITRNVDSTYSFDYARQASLSEGVALFGTNVIITLNGESSADTVTRAVYLPKKLVNSLSDFPDALNTSKDLTLKWAIDNRNPWGKVIIQIYYYEGLSYANDSTLPAHINTINYTVPDNGSYNISSSDLQRFPPKSYVGITIARGTQNVVVLPLSKKRVFYFSSSSVSTPPLLVSE